MRSLMRRSIFSSRRRFATMSAISSSMSARAASMASGAGACSMVGSSNTRRCRASTRSSILGDLIRSRASSLPALSTSLSGPLSSESMVNRPMTCLTSCSSSSSFSTRFLVPMLRNRSTSDFIRRSSCYSGTTFTDTSALTPGCTRTVMICSPISLIGS